MSKSRPHTTASRCIVVHRLLISASDPVIDQALLDFGAKVETPDGYFVLEAKINKQHRTCDGLRLVPKSNIHGAPIDAKTAVNHALIYACSMRDLDVVTWLTQTLGELIDINYRIGEMNALDWAVKSGYFSQDTRNDEVSICRLLLVCYGSMLDASDPANQFLVECIRNKYIDIATDLMTTWGSRFIHTDNASPVFRYLIACGLDGQDEVTELYLRLRADPLIDKLFEETITKTAHCASIRVFRYILNAFPARCESINRGHMFENLCKVSDGPDCAGKIIAVPDCADKIMAALDAWSDSLTPQNIENGLVHYWQWEACAADQTLRDQMQRAVLVVIERYVDKLEERGIEIAMTLCVMFQNMELMDRLIYNHSSQLAVNPRLWRHPLIICCWLSDIDTLGHLLSTCRRTVCVSALELWCEAGDLEAVTMILDSSCQDLIDCLPNVLLSACQRGDTDLVELLVRYASDSIRDSDYVKALNEACYNNHGDVVRTLVTLCGHHFSIRTDADYELDLTRTNPDIIHLLNDLFGSSLDPSIGSNRRRTVVGSREHDVKYDVGMRTVYGLYAN